MSVFVSSWVWKQEMKPTNKLVLLKLADHARDDGTKVFPSVATIATHTGMSERQVQRILKELVEDGVLTIVAHENGGRGRSREYEFTQYKNSLEKGDTCDDPPSDERVTSDTRKGDIHTKRVTSETEKGDTGVTPTVREPSSYPSEPLVGQTPIQPRDIVNVWAEVCNGGVWPVNKGPALRAAKTLVDGGITPDDARSLIAWMQADDFWGKKAGIDLGKMVKAADAWRSRQSAVQAKRERLVY